MVDDTEDNQILEQPLRRAVRIPRLLRHIDYDAIVSSLICLLILV